MLAAVAALGSMQNGCHRGTALCFLVPFHISHVSSSLQVFFFFPSNNASPKAALLSLTDTIYDEPGRCTVLFFLFFFFFSSL